MQALIFKGAKAFYDWLQSREGLRLILNHRIDGEQLLIRHFTGVTGEELRFSTS